MRKKYTVSPEHLIDEPLLCKILFDSWPKNAFNEITGNKQVKAFYDTSFEMMNKRLYENLNNIHPAGWMLEAYKQLELWTVLFYKEDHSNVKGPSQLAAGGRYGWRYVIEKSLEGVGGNIKYSKVRPDKVDINRVFTLLLGLGMTSEISNYLHYLQNSTETASVQFSPYTYAQDITCKNTDERRLIDGIRSYVFENQTDFKKYPNASPNSDIVIEKIDEFLFRNYKINTSTIESICVSIEAVCSSLNASILVQPYDDFIDLIHSLGNISHKEIQTVFQMALLDVNHPSYEERDFLRKSQLKRMINHCGMIVNLEGEFEAIYDSKSALRKDVLDAKKHVIISPILFAEWLNNLIFRIVLGQRSDLKVNEKIKKELSTIESFYHKTIFENVVKEVCESNGYQCITIEKKDGILIECGEIDIIAYNAELKHLVVIECKSLAPIIDARSMGQIMSDHFKQKKYHQKFLKKINWVKDNIDYLNEVFIMKCIAGIKDGVDIDCLFVTTYNSIIKFLVTEYKVMNLPELDEFLSNEK